MKIPASNNKERLHGKIFPTDKKKHVGVKVAFSFLYVAKFSWTWTRSGSIEFLSGLVGTWLGIVSSDQGVKESQLTRPINPVRLEKKILCLVFGQYSF